MNTLILSIHIHRINNHWKQLQPQFVADTIGDYEYGVIVNGDNPDDYKNVVAHIQLQVSHLQAIATAIELFKQHRDKFTHFLLLDSDCFPIRPDWQLILNKLLAKQYKYAAPTRVENFDWFPHPCAFFMKANFLDTANFDYLKTINLLGIEASDVGMAMPKTDDQNQQIWFPLLKTNKLSPHPLYSSVYGDLFYHHCAGSRGPGFRAGGYHFYDHIIDKKQHKKIYDEQTAKLVNQPRKFIDELRGVD